MTVESVDDEFPVAAEHLCRGDEVVAVDGEPIAIRDDPQYDSRCRKAAFAALKSRIAKAPRPVTLRASSAGRGRIASRIPMGTTRARTGPASWISSRVAA